MPVTSITPPSDGTGDTGRHGESDFSPRKVVIATACLLGSTFVPYVQATTGPLFMLPMIKEFGWTRTEYAFASTFLFVFGSITVLLYGRVADRIGVRPVVLIGALCGGATMLLLSFQNADLWRLYGTYALLGTFGSSGVAYTKVIGALFTRHRGKALAIFGAESTVALAVLPVLTNLFITHFGWRGAYVAFGVIMIVLGPILYFAIQEPGANTQGRAPSGPPPPMEGMTASEIRRDRVFWLVVLTAVLGGGLSQGMTAHIVAAITDKGFSPTVAAEALSAATLVGLVGTFAGGFAVDHFRTAKVMSGFGLVSALGALIFAVVTVSVGGLPLLITSMAIQGAAFAAMRPGVTYLQTRFFGLRAFGEANAMQVVIQGIAMAASPPLFGMIYDRTGSYAPVYWIMVGAALAGAAVYLGLGPYRYSADVGADRSQIPLRDSGDVSGPDAAGALAATRRET